jgi:hypothetical protein
MKMINHSQGEASIGEYATTMQRYFKQLEGIRPQRQMSYFVKNLNMGLRESTFAGHPKNLSKAIELARDAENMYISLPGQQNLGKQVSSLQRSVQDLCSAQRAGGMKVNAMNPAMNSASTGFNNQNGSIGQGVNTPVQERPCLACGEMDHIPRDCRERKNQYFSCCKFWKRHRIECPQNTNPLPIQNNNPLAQNSLWMEGMDSDKEYSNDEPDMQEFYAAEEEIDLECPETSDSEWYSIDEEDEEEEDKEIYARKRTREGDHRNEKENRAPKAQRREMNDVPPKKRNAKSVLHPLTKEEKGKRAETRKHNRELQQEQNGGIIRVLLKDCLLELVSHKHISHFRTDLHRHIDKVMFFDRE